MGLTPRLPPRSPVPLSMTHTAPPGPRPTVLVFEDEALVAMLVEDLLARAGFQAVWALDGRGSVLPD